MKRRETQFTQDMIKEKNNIKVPRKLAREKKTEKLEMSNLIYVRKSKVETSRNRKREKKSSGIK